MCRFVFNRFVFPFHEYLIGISCLFFCAFQMFCSLLRTGWTFQRCACLLPFSFPLPSIPFSSSVLFLFPSPFFTFIFFSSSSSSLRSPLFPVFFPISFLSFSPVPFSFFFALFPVPFFGFLVCFVFFSGVFLVWMLDVYFLILRFRVRLYIFSCFLLYFNIYFDFL